MDRRKDVVLGVLYGLLGCFGSGQGVLSRSVERSHGGLGAVGEVVGGRENVTQSSTCFVCILQAVDLRPNKASTYI